MRIISPLLTILLFLTNFLFTDIAFAQDQSPNHPVYVVESGDTYYSIAIKFGVTVDELAAANPQLDPNMLPIGAEVVIPGLEGVQGKLITQATPLGETLRSLSIRNRINQNKMSNLNHLTSPAEVFAGATLIIPQTDNPEPLTSRFLLSSETSLFQTTLQAKTNPWLAAEINQVKNTWDFLPGEVVYYPLENSETTVQVNSISPAVQDLSITPLPILQGETAVISITTTQPVEFSGSLAGYELHFVSPEPNKYIALQGVYVMADPGIYPFSLTGKLTDGSVFAFDQMLILQALGYVKENIQGVDPATLDPANTKPEEDQIRQVISHTTPVKYWSGVFVSPGYDPEWITSTFGNRRSYNGGPYSYYHSGIDYGGGTGLPITAPAPGIVVFAGPLVVRGNATIIDHGWGVYSGFWHQSEIQVAVGDKVETGQIIGLIGGTGRVTGPHLHWEMWVNGVHVDPYSWLVKTYP